MSQITLDIPEESLLALKVSVEEMGEALCLAAAVKLYELGRLSSGAAARLAGLPRTVFLSRLADYGVDTFRLTEEDLQSETRLQEKSEQVRPRSASRRLSQEGALGKGQELLYLADRAVASTRAVLLR